MWPTAGANTLARARFLQALPLYQHGEDRSGEARLLNHLGSLALALTNLGNTLLWQGQLDQSAAHLHESHRAALLLGAAQSQRVALRMPVPAHDLAHYERYRKKAQRLLGRPGVGRVLAEGGARASAAAPAPAAAEPPLTARQLEIQRLICGGLSSKEIGERLGLSTRTVEKHEDNMRTRLDLPNRAALVAWAARNGII